MSLKNTRLFFLLLSLVYLGVVIFNYGFIGVDEYWVAMVKYLPAQTTLLQNMVASDDVKSPSQFILFFVLAKAAYFMGLENPFWQYRFVLAVLTVLSCTVSVFSFKKISEVLEKGTEGRSSLFSVFLILFTFHAVMPASVSRPMFESLALPWLLFSAAFAVRYDLLVQRRDLMWSVAGVCLAFCFRPQTGLCALVPPLLALLHRRPADFLWTSALGLAVFLLNGLPDIYYHGSYHASLLTVFVYNAKHGADYGAQPWYYFLPLVFLFTFLPFFIARYSPEVWVKIKQMRAVIWMLLLFLFLHSLFANKFERFLLPAFGLMLMLMGPLMLELLQNFAKHKVRFVVLAFFNFPAWFLASFFPAQKNMIDFSLYLAAAPAITKLTVVNEAVEWLPEALMSAPAPKLKHVSSAALAPAPVGYWCLREHEYAELKNQFSSCRQIEDFPSTPLDTLAYRLNKSKNMRRAPLVLIECPRSGSP